MPVGWLDHAATRTAAAELRCILQATLTRLHAPYWAIKDPRTSRLLPMWLRVAEELQIPLQLLIAIRDPAEVIHSLVKRDGPITGMDSRRAQALWWRFNLEPLQAAPADLPITRIHYGEWFEQPEQQLQRLLAALPWLSPSTEQCRSALQRIRPEHRHNQLDARTTPDVLRRVYKLYELLRRPEWEGPWPEVDPPRRLNRRDDQPPPPQRLAAHPESWPAWLEHWQYHPAARLCEPVSLAPRLRIKLYGLHFHDPITHLWLQRLPLGPISCYDNYRCDPGGKELQITQEAGHVCTDGLARITLNLEEPTSDERLAWLEQLRGEQAIWDPEPARVLLMRALGLPAHWLDPAAPTNGWLQQSAAADAASWSTQLGMAPPTPTGVIVLGQADAAWDHALRDASFNSDAGGHARPDLAPADLIDYRPGWANLICRDVEAALAQAGWLVCAAQRAKALVWPQASERPWINLLEADAVALLHLAELPLTPARLKAQITPRPQEALAEDRPAPHTLQLFHWRGNRQPEVAVVVTLYNYRDRILEALASVAAQRQQYLELIVVDDASTDGGEARVLAWMQEHSNAEDHPFSSLQLWRHERNTGLAAARNTGFSRSQTEWCFVLDADNLLSPEAVSACLGLAMAGTERLAVVHPIIAVEAEPGMVTEQRSLVAGPSWQREILTQGNAVDAMALVRRRAWEAVGGYTHIEGGWEDYDLWCKLIEQGWHGLQCPRVLALYRSHPASMSATVTNSSWPPLRRTLQKRHPWLQLETD
jgi:GT2 family glycosyltransferase